MKTARFADVVKQSGAPEVYLLWVPPKEDKSFQRALKEQRIMTVHQELVGTKKDFATVGFTEEANAQYLVFPKSVKRFADRHVVGINYDLLARQSRPSLPAKPKSRKTERTPQTTAASAKPEEKDSDQIIPFAAPEKPEPPAQVHTPEPPPADEPDRPLEPTKNLLDPRALSEIKKAMKELRAGKTVPAYERLAALVNSAAS